MVNLELSVHGLVDFLLRRGNIDTRVYNNSSMAEGSRIHLRYQLLQDGNYLSEQELSVKMDIGEYSFFIHGRADGIIINQKYPIIDEIKTTVMDLRKFHEEQEEWHLGQAKVYGYMYALNNHYKKIGVRLTYISQKDNDERYILNYNYSLEELEAYVKELLNEYLKFYSKVNEHNEKKITSSSSLEFPFSTYRKGQRELAKYVYGTIVNNDILFVEAPTGIGKTMSTIYPAVKTFSEGTEKIFYLSAKGIAKDVAFNACKILMEHGLTSKVIKLNSKEKMCQCDKVSCNPDDCPFAVGYYDKIKDIIKEIFLNEDALDDEVILRYANKYSVCSFELQLDVSLFCDVIICDYNYVFDPLVYLKRYFDDSKTSFVALIDETHNLIDRSRDMYSSELKLSSFLTLQAKIKKFKNISFKRILKKLIIKLEEHLEDEIEFTLTNGNFNDDFYTILYNYFKQSQDILKNHPEMVSDYFTECFREVNRFLKISEFYSSSFKCYFHKTENDVSAIIKCVDASKLIKSSLDKLKSSIFFSATLTPMEYYVKSLGGNEDTPVIKLDSPFDQNNLLTLVRTDISTRYKDRNNTYHLVASLIENVISKKVGNYLVFFSSYQYLENVLKELKPLKDVEYLAQNREMNDKEREIFLKRFVSSPLKTTVGLAVLGGAFSEGIDLVSDKLIGAIIVGVGLPQISFERDLIKTYYDQNEENGFDYSYVNPGITKIIQAAGRVIRSEDDHGVVVFIDDRFTQFKYQDIFKKEFKNSYFMNSNDKMNEYLEEFWSNH